MQCFRCTRPAVLFQRYSGRSLCTEHLCADIESRAKRVIRQNRWLVRGDRIGVLSGMVHSDALAVFLEHLLLRRSDIILIRIDPIPDFVWGTGSWYQELSKICAKAGVTRLALPYAAEDLAGEILTGILRGDSDSLLSSTIPDLIIPVMQPLQEIPAEELEIYASYYVGVREKENSSSKDQNHFRSFELSVHNLILEFSSLHPSAPHALRRYRDRLRDLQMKTEPFSP